MNITYDFMSKLVGFFRNNLTLWGDSGEDPPADNPCQLRLITEEFTPGRVIPDWENLSVPDWSGYADKLGVADAQPSYVNPLTGQVEFRVKDPEGGWSFTSSTGGTYPMTIYGVLLIASDEETLLGSALFPEPIVLTSGSQGIPIGELTFASDIAGVA